MCLFIKIFSDLTDNQPPGYEMDVRICGQNTNRQLN